jgi:hypothetical protein
MSSQGGNDLVQQDRMRLVRRFQHHISARQRPARAAESRSRVPRMSSVLSRGRAWRVPAPSAPQENIDGPSADGAGRRFHGARVVVADIGAPPPASTPGASHGRRATSPAQPANSASPYLAKISATVAFVAAPRSRIGTARRLPAAQPAVCRRGLAGPHRAPPVPRFISAMPSRYTSCARFVAALTKDARAMIP